MNRRKFISLLYGVSAPFLAASARSAEPIRRIGVLISIADDGEGQARINAFRQKLKELGHLEGRDVLLDMCWANGDANRAGACAAELVRSTPDVILSSGPESLVALRQQTQQIPVVFVQIGAPVESGIASSLAHPGGNVTGSAAFEHSFASKWIELLRQIAPGLSRVGVLRNPAAFTQSGYVQTIEATAASLGMQVVVRDANNLAEIEPSIEALTGESNGLIVLPSSLAAIHRERIVSLANRSKLPAIYAYRFFTDCGGLLSYGNNVPETFRQAAIQVDHILRGARAGDLPIQFSPKVELVINMRTAKALGLEVPRPLLVRADEVIE
jgi:putative tryptophan/tyrosine transport system substrate-binding protein